MVLDARLLNPTAKVFLDDAPAEVPGEFTGLRGEVISFQLAFTVVEGNGTLAVSVSGLPEKCVRVRQVRQVPVIMPTYPGADDQYLRDQRPGLYPDALMDMRPHCLWSRTSHWESLWLDVEPGAPGDYDLDIALTVEETGEIAAQKRVRVHVLDARLPRQELIHTKWFHSDCLAAYYHVDVFSEEYWRIVENYVSLAVKRGINMLLTPIHTPPLDTREGSERPTVQLVDVYLEDGKYRFGFEKLRRWVDMCKGCGVEYYEMAHLFTQWGARHAPKIVAHTSEGEQRIFGWETDATGPDYAAFLGEYLPALTEELKRLGIADRCSFHISDEPGVANLAEYTAAKALVAPYLKDFRIMDALSNLDFYKQGLVDHPVVAINHIEPFLEAGVPELWGYYCCGQYKDVTNVFIAMPGARTRALGAQAFKFDLEGFLQWGFNFYNVQLSDYPIDPWAVTDGYGSWPAGDPFQVYPDEDGQPADSLRSMLFLEAMQDLRAMRLLESLAGRRLVLDLIDEGLDEPLRFDKCPYTDEYVLGLRDKVNREIAKRL